MAGPESEPVPATVKSVLRSPDLVFREVRYAGDCAMPLHAHGEAHLFVCLAGTVEHIRSRESRLLSTSMLAFIPDGEPHANRFHDHVRTFDVVLKPDWVERLRAYAPLVKGPAEFERGPATWLGMRLHREFARRDSLTPLVLEGLTLELLAQLSRATPAPSDCLAPRWLVRTVDYLHAHFAKSLSLDEIAAEAGVHPDHLTRTFRRHYRVSVGDYVRRLRVEYACHRLTTSTAPLSQIALECGFADQSHFHKQFKALVGVTPSRFRASTGAGFRQTSLP